MKKKVAVSGAGGFIGTALVKKLLEKDYYVYGLDVSEKMLEKFSMNKNFVPIVADFTMYKNLEKLLPNNLDVFYHLAWDFNKMNFKDYETQIKNAIYSCDAVAATDKLHCKKFVFAGSMNEYEINSFVNMDYIKPRYTYVYSISKFLAESVAKTICYNENKMEICFGRIAMVYGPGNNLPNIANVAIYNLVHGIPLKLVKGNGAYDLVYSEDVASAFIAMGEKGKNMKTYYVGHRELNTFKEIIERMAFVINPKCERLYGVYPDAETSIDFNKIDLDALYKDTGFSCSVSFEDSIRRTADWLKNHPLPKR